MSNAAPAFAPDSFASFGELLLYLRRRARLKQRDLAIATGYSEAQISRLEKNQRLPDHATLAALFVPALGIEGEPRLAGRLLDLAAAARGRRPVPDAAAPAPAQPAVALEPIPTPAPHEVARPRALERLRARLASERRLALCGLPGAGKTTLAAAAARAHDGPVLWINLTDRVTGSAEAITRRIAQFIQANGSAQAAPLLRPDEAPALPPDRQAGLLAAGLAELAAAGPPPLICLDNFYHVQYDAAVVRLLEHLAAATNALGLLISREAVPLPGLASLTLGGLEDDEATGLVAALGGARAGLDAGLAARLAERSGGNPMLLRLAIAQLLDEGGDARAFVERLETRPQVARHLLDALRERLSPAAWRLLSVVAVLRRPVDLYDELLVELMAEAGEPYELGLALGELQRMLLIDDPARATLHPLLRDHVYASLVADLPRRRRLHRVAAEWAERGHGDLLLAAFHYARADELQQAVEVLADRAEPLREAGQALAAADVVDELLTRARRAPNGRGADLICPLLTLRGDLLAPTARGAEAEADYRAALAAAAHPAVRGRIATRLATCMMQRGRADGAIELIAEARAALDAPDTLLRTELLIAEGWAYRSQARYDDLLALTPAGLALADRLAEVLPREAERARATILGNEAYVRYARRDLDAAGAALARARSAAERSGSAQTVLRYEIVLAHLGLAAGDLGAVERVVGAALPAIQAMGTSLLIEYALCLRMAARLLSGDLGGARADLDEALALREALGMLGGVTVNEGFYPTALIALGRADEARAFLARVTPRLPSSGEGRALAYNLERSAALALLAGDAAGAPALLERAAATPAARSDARLGAELASRAALATALAGDLAGASELAAADAPAEAGTWAALERTAARAAIAAARADAAATAAALAALSERAASSGHRLYLATAARIAALGAPPAPAELPALLWVHG